MTATPDTPVTPSPPAPFQWRFFRAGGFDQVAIDSAEHLRHLASLDQKLWVALACPVVGNEIDDRTLALIDRDNDGRIRAPELLEAIRWADERLASLETVLEGRDGLRVADLQAPKLKESLAALLEAMERPADGAITVAETLDATQVLDRQPFNGDGVVPVASAEDPQLASTIQAILDTVGGTKDRGGEQGIDRAAVERFYTELAAFRAWRNQAATAEDDLVPLGDGTAAAVEAYVAVRAKVDDWFTRCALAQFDARSTSHLAGEVEDFEALADQTLTPDSPAVAAFPLAAIRPGEPLPLEDGVNPAWATRVEAFRTKTIQPLLGERSSLDFTTWRELKSRFAPYEKWLGEKKGAVVEPLGAERLDALATDDDRAALIALIEKDEARAAHAEAVHGVARAARYQRDLLEVVRNFVNFRQFYRLDTLAMFQAGTLYLDGRSCDLVLRVDDIDKHAKTAPQSYLCLAYCKCTRKVDDKTMNIVAAFTDGDDDFLAVGRNGLFYDRHGRDWDATIVRLELQPISIRQAFWAPYKKLATFLGDRVEQFVAAQEKASGEGLLANGTSGNAFDIGRFAGIFAAIGLGLGFLASALTAMIAGLLSLAIWQIPLVLLGLVLLISGPSMAMAAFKLSRRNLAPALDACGWAVNTRARINVPFGERLTSVAKLPKNAHRDNRDPFGDRRNPWWLVLGLLFVVFAVGVAWDAGLFGKLQDWAEKNAAEKNAAEKDVAEQAAPAPAPAPAP